MVLSTGALLAASSLEKCRDHTHYRGSYMSVHILLNLLNELRKRDQMRGLPSILSFFLQRV